MLLIPLQLRLFPSQNPQFHLVKPSCQCLPESKLISHLLSEEVETERFIMVLLFFFLGVRHCYCLRTEGRVGHALWGLSHRLDALVSAGGPCMLSEDSRHRTVLVPQRFPCWPWPLCTANRYSFRQAPVVSLAQRLAPVAGICLPFPCSVPVYSP